MDDDEEVIDFAPARLNLRARSTDLCPLLCSLRPMLGHDRVEQFIAEVVVGNVLRVPLIE